MLVFFIYDASGCTVFNQENKNVPGYEKQELGRYVVNLDPLHLSREMNWVKYKLKRLGYKKSSTHKKVVETLSHGLRAKEHVCIEL